VKLIPKTPSLTFIVTKEDFYYNAKILLPESTLELTHFHFSNKVSSMLKQHTVNVPNMDANSLIVDVSIFIKLEH